MFFSLVNGARAVDGCSVKIERMDVLVATLRGKIMKSLLGSDKISLEFLCRDIMPHFVGHNSRLTLNALPSFRRLQQAGISLRQPHPARQIAIQPSSCHTSHKYQLGEAVCKERLGCDTRPFDCLQRNIFNPVQPPQPLFLLAVKA